ncbi:MAG: hypothetical protein V1647_02165, partial [Pseudomonadota bacterium]
AFLFCFLSTSLSQNIFAQFPPDKTPANGPVVNFKATGHSSNPSGNPDDWLKIYGLSVQTDPGSKASRPVNILYNEQLGTMDYSQEGTGVLSTKVKADVIEAIVNYTDGNGNKFAIRISINRESPNICSASSVYTNYDRGYLVSSGSTPDGKSSLAASLYSWALYNEKGEKQAVISVNPLNDDLVFFKKITTTGDALLMGASGDELFVGFEYKDKTIPRVEFSASARKHGLMQEKIDLPKEAEGQFFIEDVVEKVMDQRIAKLLFGVYNSETHDKFIEAFTTLSSAEKFTVVGSNELQVKVPETADIRLLSLAESYVSLAESYVSGGPKYVLENIDGIFMKNDGKILCAMLESGIDEIQRVGTMIFRDIFEVLDHPEHTISAMSDNVRQEYKSIMSDIMNIYGVNIELPSKEAVGQALAKFNEFKQGKISDIDMDFFLDPELGAARQKALIKYVKSNPDEAIGVLEIFSCISSLSTRPGAAITPGIRLVSLGGYVDVNDVIMNNKKLAETYDAKARQEARNRGIRKAAEARLPK